LQVNLTGTFNMCKQAVMRMSGRRFGRIVNITSPSGELGFPGQGNYAASKAGQIAFTRSLAKEVARRNIAVNCLSPGFIDTDLIADLPEEQLKEYRKNVPMRRFGTVEEVAEAVLFLLSDKATYITGEVLRVTGGL
jgi:3-oxoacyl-[acyl-carrier protein] reductase